MIDPVSFTGTTPRLSLPLLFAGQSQKEFLVNETLMRLDTLLAPVIQAERAAPPDDADTGEAFLIADNAAGEWAGRSGSLAVSGRAGWSYIAAVRGMRLYDAERGESLLFDDGWRRPAAVPAPDGGANVDSEARDALSDLLTALRALGIIR